MADGCKVASVLAAAPARDRALLAAWCDNRRDEHGRIVGASVLAAAFTREGMPIGATTLKDHRAGRCACAREGAES